MSRHRNVRTMDYSEEYDGFDDVYGHSVEEDYCISPSDAAQFMFDRSTRQPQMSAFFNEENDIAEEDELDLDVTKEGNCRRDSENYQRPGLNEEDEARMRSCLDEIRNVIGDSIPEQILVDAVLKNDFNFNKALDAVLSSSSAGKSEGAPKPQRERKNRDRDDTASSLSPQFNPFSYVSNINAHSLRANMEKLEIKDRDRVLDKIPSTHASSVPLGQCVGDLSNSKFPVSDENVLEGHKITLLKDSGNVPTRQLVELTSNFGSVDFVPTKSEGSSPSNVHRTGESYNSNSASGNESSLKLNIPKLKLKVRNDSEKENFEDDNDCMSSLQSLRPQIKRGIVEDHGSLTNLALDHNVPYTSLSQLAEKHTFQNPNLSSQVTNSFSLAQLDHSAKSFHLPSLKGRQNISSLTELENKQENNKFKFQPLEENNISSLTQLAKKCSAKSLTLMASEEDSTFSSLTDLSDKFSLQSSEQDISCSQFSSLSQLASRHSRKLNQASIQDEHNFSSLTELANKHSNLSVVRESKSERQFLPFAVVTAKHQEDSISSLADLASSHLKISGKLNDVMKKQNITKAHSDYTSDSSDLSSKHKIDPSHLTSPNPMEKEREIEFEFLKANKESISHRPFVEPYLMDSDQSCQSMETLDDEKESNWVIDLTCALQSPNSLATQSQSNLNNAESEGIVNPKLCKFSNFALDFGNDLNNLHQDLTDIDSSNFTLDYENGLKLLHQNLSTLKKPSSSFGRIVCKKWKLLNIPYIKRKNQVLEKIVHFTFNTPSPDDKILEHLRRK